ncbi:MAG: shikimate dehydrogenase [Candidatus Izimaplasma sp.]|nr:shikimate dehydrogenase [Candidatus Izimaplasma bacterium]
MYGLIGKKLKHSYSKEIHEKLHKEKYNLIELHELDSFFQEKKFKGVNITNPYKNDVIAYCDKLSEIATRTHSVNSIVNTDGVLYGYNTDYDGLSFMLKHNKVSLKNMSVLILGNGSTSRTVKTLCFAKNAKEIIIAARNPGPKEINLNALKNNTNIDIIFNTTPVGMFPNNEESLEINLNDYSSLKVVIDLIYNPFETKLLNSARNKNIETINGLLMLVHQAVKSSEIFHDVKYKKETTINLYKSILLKKTNLVLIGMPMSGKSYFTRLLGSKYNKKIVDIDKLIEKNLKYSIATYFKTHGEKAFRKLETMNIMKIAKSNNQAISVGGGAVLHKKNIEYLKQNGIIIFLDVPLDLLKTFNPNNRPLLKGKRNIEKLYQDRYHLYKEYADITVSKETIDEFKTLSMIEVKINEYFNT